GAWKQRWPDPSLGRALLQDAAVVAGWWHVVLWVFGMLRFRQATAAVPPRPAAAPWRRVLLGLGGAAALPPLVSHPLDPHGRNALLLSVTTAVFACSTVVFTRLALRLRRLGVSLLAAAVGLYTLERLHYTFIHVSVWQTWAPPLYLACTSCA